MPTILINIKNGKEHPIKTLAEAKQLIRDYPGTFKMKEGSGVSGEADKLIKKSEADAKKAAAAAKKKKKADDKLASGSSEG